MLARRAQPVYPLPLPQTTTPGIRMLDLKPIFISQVCFYECRICFTRQFVDVFLRMGDIHDHSAW